MKYLFLFILFSIVTSCDKETPEERFKRLCPYEFTLGKNHLLKIPFEIIPNKLTYKVGDTIIVRSRFKHDIYDLSTQKSFQLDSILLRPRIGIFRFFNNFKWERTNNENYIIFDNKYTHTYGNSTFALFNKDGDYFDLEFKILLKKSGRYTMVIEDLFSNVEEEYYFQLRNSISNSELCKNVNVQLCNMIDGDTHMKELEPEFIYVDKELSYDNYYSILDKNSSGVYNSGSYAWEYNGAYGFIVEE